MSSVVADLRFAIRLMTRGPGLTVILVTTLALGIATSTAIFSVVDSVLIKPLPYKNPDRLVRMYSEFLGKMQLRKFWISAPEYQDIARDCRSCEAVAAWAKGTASLSGGDRPVRVEAAYATANLLPTLGVTPLLGRTFDASEDTPGDARVIVLGYNVWKRAFGGDPGVLGKHILIDANPATIIGVMPAGFDFLGGEEAWLPLGLDPAKLEGRASHFLEVIARLKPGVTSAAFGSEIAALTKAWANGVPVDRNVPGIDHHFSDGHPLIFLPLHDDIVGSLATPLWLLQFASLFVLLIAIVNVANLLLARSETRTREIAVRHALGARRRRLIRQFLTESLVLGLLGGALGVLIAVWALDGILALIPKSAPRVNEIHLDAGAVGFAALLSIGASVLFGLAPILHARKTDIHGSLKDGSPRMTGSKARQRVRRGLVIAEVALALVLVVGCATMIKSFIALQNVDVGMRPDHLLTAEIELPKKNYADLTTVNGFWQRLEDRLDALPGVEKASVVSGLPPLRRMVANDIELPDTPRGPDDPPRNVDYMNPIGDDGVATLGMRVLKGRALGAGDTAGAPVALMINQRFADRYFPDIDPIGKQIRIEGGDAVKPGTVVGVVADVKQAGIDRPAGTEVFYTPWQAVPFTEGPEPTLSVVVRTKGDPGAMGPQLVRAVNALDPTLPVSKLRTMDDLLWEAVARPRFLTFLMTAFAIMALLLAGVGIYGVMAHTVEQRTHEIGLRVALGAQPKQVRRMVLRQAGSLAVIGAAVGVGVVAALQFGLGAKMKTVLYGAALADPLVLAGVAVVVLAAALLATWIPARRATRVEPMVALRTE